jgi:hypothetical protein
MENNLVLISILRSMEFKVGEKYVKRENNLKDNNLKSSIFLLSQIISIRKTWSSIEEEMMAKNTLYKSLLSGKRMQSLNN